MASVFLFWIVCAILGGAIGSTKGRIAEGIVWGLLVGPIGVLITCFLKPATEAAHVASGESKKCPFCAEVIKKEAKVCRFCSRDVVETPTTSAEKQTGSAGQSAKDQSLTDPEELTFDEFKNGMIAADEAKRYYHENWWRYQFENRNAGNSRKTNNEA